MYKNQYKEPQELNGKTIKTCEMIRAEHYRTYPQYLLLVFTDGTRHILGVDSFEPYKPDPDAEEMKRAPSFFSKEEVAEKIERDERKRLARLEEQRRKKMQELRRLKKELGM